MTPPPPTALHTRDDAALQSRDRDRLERFNQTWSEPTGFEKLATVNNDPIGKSIMIAAFSFLLIGGVIALLMRIQLAIPENTFMGPQVYNQLFTMHGSTMMYLFAVPFLEGLVIMILPPMLGSRDMAFPRISALGFWTFIFSGLMFYASFIFGAPPEVGWFAYTPLSGPRYSGLGTDFWLIGLGMAELAGISAGVEIVITVLKMRAPGMTVGRIPLFAWAVLVMGVMILFAFTTLLTATLLLEMDRMAGTHFFNPAAGGNPLLWQHLFWFFGHPEVYIIFLPATGIVSMIVAAFAKRISGYALIATAIVITGFVSFGLWVHHMYTTGLPELSMHFFAAASLMIAIASGVQVFAWIASLWGSRAPLHTPLLFVIGFLIIFVIGGLTGVMVAIVPFDWQVHDTYFIVAHFHYVLIGGAVFPILGGLYYWLPKMTGRMLDERLGKWSFWLAFIGFNVTFFPMHIMGFEGMPRRVYTYPAVLGIGWMNMLATIGAFVLGAGFLVFVVDFVLSYRRGKRAGDNPWGADSLEWSISSPPPPEVFFTPPVVHGRHPVWKGFAPHADPATNRAVQALAGAPEDWRGSLVTEALTAKPQAIVWLPRTSFQPLIISLSLAIGSAAAILKAYLLAAFSIVPMIIALYLWLRPDDRLIKMLRDSDLPARSGLPIFTTGSKSISWWGAVGLLAILGTILMTLLYSYFYIRLYAEKWPLGAIEMPKLLWPSVAYGLLLVSVGAQWWASQCWRDGQRRRSMEIALFASMLLGLAFAIVEFVSLLRLDYGPTTNAYGSLFFTLNGWALLLALGGIGVNLANFARSLQAPDDPLELRTLHLQIAALLWYFVVISGLIVFATAYLSPYVI